MCLRNASEEWKKKKMLAAASLFHCGGQVKDSESHSRLCRIRDVFAFATKEWAGKLTVFLGNGVTWVRLAYKLKVPRWVFNAYIRFFLSSVISQYPDKRFSLH